MTTTSDDMINIAGTIVSSDVKTNVIRQNATNNAVAPPPVSRTTCMPIQ